MVTDEIPEYLQNPADPEAPGQAPRSGLLRFARMAGSSIAARNAAFWITDFLNAAYYRRPPEERDVDDLRLAFSILTTHWNRKTERRRRQLSDLPAFHRAFGAHRFATGDSGRGTLSRRQLVDGAGALLGDWFADAYADSRRRGWGIAFPTVADREADDPECRLRLARLGALTPERAPLDQQVWAHLSAGGDALGGGGHHGAAPPETWPDYASEIGRFTPLRRGGLDGQTFEIEVAAGTATGRPLFTRGHVTITQLVTPDTPEALGRWIADLEEGLARYGAGDSRAVPEGGQPLVGLI